MYACNTPNLFEDFIFELCRNWLELQVFSIELSLSKQRSLDQSWSQQYVVLKSLQLPFYTPSWPWLLLGIKFVTWKSLTLLLWPVLLFPFCAPSLLLVPFSKWKKNFLWFHWHYRSCFSNYVAYQPQLSPNLEKPTSLI